MILEKQPIFYDMKEIAPLLNGMRVISNNINQVARKANETHNVTAADVEILRKEVDSLFRSVSTLLSTLLSTKV